MKKNLSEYNIVIVDDEQMVTSSLNSLLKLEGYKNVNTFNNPLEAFEYVKISKIDLIISDFFMPEMNGIELLKEVRKIDSGATLVLLTGYADKESAIKAINEIGLYRYIEKPWDNDDLTLCIKNGLERSHLIENLERYNRELELIVAERTSDLRKTNNKLSSIINYSADGIVSVSKDGIITQSNPAFNEMCGIEGPVSRNISDICENKSHELIHTRLNSENYELVRNYNIKNLVSGRFIPIEINFAPVIKDSKQEASYYIGVIRDVTLQQEMERLRDDFIATLTHDLRTPLLAVIQTLQFFLDGTVGELSEKQKLLLDTMKKSNEDMLGLVNALLEVYKYESGQLILYKERFSLSEIIENCCKEVQPLADNRELALNCADIENKKIYADKREIKRVVANLLGNSINHTRKGGNIDVSAHFNSDETIISVTDTGIGIPKEDLPKLFNRFSQGTGKKRSTNTGLGLYLSRQIVEAHEGKIWAESNFNKGSRFMFSIPVVDEHKIMSLNNNGNINTEDIN